jgi:hypothetical protein
MHRTLVHPFTPAQDAEGTTNQRELGEGVGEREDKMATCFFCVCSVPTAHASVSALTARLPASLCASLSPYSQRAVSPIDTPSGHRRCRRRARGDRASFCQRGHLLSTGTTHSPTAKQPDIVATSRLHEQRVCPATGASGLQVIQVCDPL